MSQNHEHEWVGPAKENAKRIESKLGLMMPPSNGVIWTNEISKKFWAHVREVLKMFDERLLKADRDRLWALKEQACERAKSLQDRANFRKSLQHYNFIIKNVIAADAYVGTPPSTLLLKHYGQLLTKANKYIHENKHEMITKHKNEIYEEIQRIRKKHDAHWREKQSSWRNRIRANVAKNLARIIKATATLKNVEENVRNLRREILAGGSVKYLDRQEIYLAESEAKATDIRESIILWQGWVDKEQDKLEQ